MAKSLRSKWKRKMKAIKRVRYGQKENDRLIKMLKDAKADEESKSQEVLPDKDPEVTEETMEVEGKIIDFNAKTLKNKHGTFPVWVPNRKIKRLTRKGTKGPFEAKQKKPTKKRNSRKF